MDTYPRFTAHGPSGRRHLYRVSAKAIVLSLPAEAFVDLRWTIDEVAPPRFRIKVATWPTKNPIVLTDRNRRGFRGQYRTLDAACRAMDNTVRRERGMPERFNWTRGEVAPPPITEVHTGQHLQGCASCYAYLDDALKGAAERAGR